MRTNVIAAFPFYDLACLPGNPFAKGAGQAIRDCLVFLLLCCQISPEQRAEDRLHSSLLKVS